MQETHDGPPTYHGKPAAASPSSRHMATGGNFGSDTEAEKPENVAISPIVAALAAILTANVLSGSVAENVAATFTSSVGWLTWAAGELGGLEAGVRNMGATWSIALSNAARSMVMLGVWPFFILHFGDRDFVFVVRIMSAVFIAVLLGIYIKDRCSIQTNHMAGAVLCLSMFGLLVWASMLAALGSWSLTVKCLVVQAMVSSDMVVDHFVEGTGSVASALTSRNLRMLVRFLPCLLLEVSDRVVATVFDTEASFDRAATEGLNARTWIRLNATRVQLVEDRGNSAGTVRTLMHIERTVDWNDVKLVFDVSGLGLHRYCIAEDRSYCGANSFEPSEANLAEGSYALRYTASAEYIREGLQQDCRDCTVIYDLGCEEGCESACAQLPRMVRTQDSLYSLVASAAQVAVALLFRLFVSKASSVDEGVRQA